MNWPASRPIFDTSRWAAESLRFRKPAIKWLERLIESGQAKEVEIHISTNVTM